MPHDARFCAIGAIQVQLRWFRIPKSKDIDSLKALTGLTSLDLADCKSLQNVDGVKAMNSLGDLALRGCRNLQNIDRLKNLPSLHILDLSGCKDLQNVDGIQGLRLMTLDLSNCEKLLKKAIEDLKAASRSTEIRP
jgi:hypothetical protein